MILVIAEQRQGTLSRATWEAVAAAQHAGGPIRIVVLGASLGSLPETLAAAAVDEVLTVDVPELVQYTADGYVAALQSVIQEVGPDLVFLPHTYQTRDFAPALAARLERPLITDVVALARQDDGMVYTRPVFQGKLNADVAATGPAPHLVTFQIGAFRGDAAARGPRPPPCVPSR